MAQLINTALYSDANLVAYHILENVNDSKGSFNLTNNGTTPFNPAKYGNGADFGAANTTKYLTVNSPIFDPATDHSISLWINLYSLPTAGNSFEFINVEKNQTTGYTFIEYQNLAGTITLRMDASNGLADYVTNLTTGVWHHVVAVCSSGNLTLYLNNAVVATGTRSNDSTTQNRSAIGAKNDATKPCSAIIDDVGWFSRALTVAEVATLYRNSSGGFFNFV